MEEPPPFPLAGGYSMHIAEASEAVIIIDAQSGHIIDANEAAISFFHIPGSTLLQKRLFDFLPPYLSGEPAVPLTIANIQAALQGNNPASDWVLLDGSGKEKACTIRLVRLPPFDQKIVRISIIHCDGQNKSGLIQREEEKRFQLTLEATGLGFYDWFPFEEVIHWDKRMREIYGYPADSSQDKNEYFFQILHEEDRQRMLTGFNEIMGGASEIESFEYEYRIRTQGMIKHIYSLGHIFRNEQGQIHRVMGICQDITARKDAEQSVRESEKRYRTLFELAGDAIMTVSPPDRDIIDANQAMTHILGYSEAELKQMNGFQIIAPEMVSETQQSWYQQVEEKGSFHLETKWVTKDGERIPIAVSGKPLEIDGQFFFQLIGRDISTRIQSTDRLRFQAKLLERVEQAVIVTDFQGAIIYWNPFAEKLYGWSSEEALGKTTVELISPEISREHAEDVMRKLQNGERWSGEFLAHNKVGNQFYIHSTVTPTLNEKGEIHLLIGISEDISHSKLAEQQLRTAFQEIEALKDQLQAENLYLREEIQSHSNSQDIIFASEAINEILTQVEQVAPLDATVLITGETGTGKELIARALHSLSPRADKPMIKINCGAIPKDLVESELFGYEKGAFTGATQAKAGRFELADNSTLFLDEIGEMPQDVQVKLLRAIQEGEFVRLGSTKTTKVDVRIIAATNRNLQKETKKGRFRQDLYFRINVFPIYVPPLRDRIEDIPILVEHFVNKYATKHGKTIQYVSQEAMNYLTTNLWPGNVRELENAIERAVILSSNQQLYISEVANSNQKQRKIKDTNLTLAEVQRNHILKVMRVCRWKIEGKEGAAEMLGLKPSTLRDRMKKLGIQRPLS